MASNLHRPLDNDSTCFYFLNSADLFQFVLNDLFETLIKCEKCTEAAANILAAPLIKFFCLNNFPIEDGKSTLVATGSRECSKAMTDKISDKPKEAQNESMEILEDEEAEPMQMLEDEEDEATEVVEREVTDRNISVLYIDGEESPLTELESDSDGSPLTELESDSEKSSFTGLESDEEEDSLSDAVLSKNKANLTQFL
jgi:hypothetical protein